MEPVVVSVIIPTHNRADMVVRAVKSVLRQTHAELEIIVVDDASNDSTEAALQALNDPRIRYHRHPVNRGACAARNTGISVATGEYVAFLDSDDEWVATKIDRQLRAFLETAIMDVGVVTCGYRSLRKSGREVVWVPRQAGWLIDDILSQKYSGWGPPFLLIRREILAEGGIRFDEKLPARQGFDFCAQLAHRYAFEIVREPLVIVHDHDGERVWTPSRAVSASLYLHDKFEAALSARPVAHSRFHLKTVVESIEARNWPEARRQVLRGIAANPRSPLVYLWLTLYLSAWPVLPNVLRSTLLRALGRVTFGTFS